MPRSKRQGAITAETKPKRFKWMGIVTVMLVLITAAMSILEMKNMFSRAPSFGWAFASHQSPTSIVISSKQVFDMETFIETFKAARPEWTDRCKAYLRSPEQYNFDRLHRESFINWEWEFSQYTQDWILFVNWLHTRGRSGFYVESGANSPLRVSNTAFYDICMGWQGLCVEPQAQHHEGIRDLRTCHLEPVCLSYQEETIHLNHEVTTREHVEGSRPIKCERLDTLLNKYNVSHVDLWSLDIEGFEMNALRGLGKFPFPDILLMEQQDMSGDGCSQMAIDYRMTALGYDKHRFVSDGIYVRREDGRLTVTNRTNLDIFARQLEGERCQKMSKELKFFDLE